MSPEALQDSAPVDKANVDKQLNIKVFIIIKLFDFNKYIFLKHIRYYLLLDFLQI